MDCLFQILYINVQIFNPGMGKEVLWILDGQQLENNWFKPCSEAVFQTHFNWGLLWHMLESMYHQNLN